MYRMKPGSVGLGDPCVQGSGGDLVDCGSFSNLGQWNCWNPFAKSYPCPGASSPDPDNPTGPPITNPGTPLPGSPGGASPLASLAPSDSMVTVLEIGVAAAVLFLVYVMVKKR
jgi:hypothetical protein